MTTLNSMILKSTIKIYPRVQRLNFSVTRETFIWMQWDSNIRLFFQLQHFVNFYQCQKDRKLHILLAILVSSHKYFICLINR